MPVTETSSIHVTLPDGSQKEVPRGTTPLDIAKSISPRLADAALVAKIKHSALSPQHPAADQPLDAAKTATGTHAPQSKDGWQFADLTKPLEQDVELRLLTDRDSDALEVYRHSSAHLLATAVLELFPETKLGHGPPTDTGFFYDFYRPTPFTPEDLEKIEKRMAEIYAAVPAPRGLLPRYDLRDRKSVRRAILVRLRRRRRR